MCCCCCCCCCCCWSSCSLCKLQQRFWFQRELILTENCQMQAHSTMLHRPSGTGYRYTSWSKIHRIVPGATEIEYVFNSLPTLPCPPSQNICPPDTHPPSHLRMLFAKRNVHVSIYMVFTTCCSPFLASNGLVPKQPTYFVCALHPVSLFCLCVIRKKESLCLTFLT